MADKIGPIQTGEEKLAGLDFTGEILNGSIVSGSCTIEVWSGEDPMPETVLVGEPIIDGLWLKQKVRFQRDFVVYLIRGKAISSDGQHHVISTYLWSRATA